jgi:hypothetical protein
MHLASGPFALLCFSMFAVGARSAAAAAPELLDLDLEQLLQIEVTANTKHLQTQNRVWPSAAPITAEDAVARRYRSIAEALINFTRFIEWPEEATGDFRLCVAGPDPFGPELDALATRPVRARPIRIERQADQSGPCQMVFVPAGCPLPPPAIGMLMVAEDADALSQGAAIVVGLDGHRVIFDINRKAASQAGLKISSKLLRLARSSSANHAARAARLVAGER